MGAQNTLRDADSAAEPYLLLQELIVLSVSTQPSPKMSSEVVITLPWMFIVF